ncbi:MAG: hypothetical protein RL723_110 [Actinomycetota bacterium]|jgi:hypothetical protein
MAIEKNPVKKQKNYVLLTGRDDSAFCQRVSDRIDEGYELYGSPSITFNIFKGHPVVAQALVLKKKAAKKPAAKRSKK